MLSHHEPDGFEGVTIGGVLRRTAGLGLSDRPEISAVSGGLCPPMGQHVGTAHAPVNHDIHYWTVSKRHYVPGHAWHITHRCHEKAFQAPLLEAHVQSVGTTDLLLIRSRGLVTAVRSFLITRV